MEQYNPEQLVDKINELGKDFNVPGGWFRAISNPEYREEEYSIGITFNFELDGFKVHYKIEKNNFVKEHKIQTLKHDHSISEVVELQNRDYKLFFRRDDDKGINSIGVGSKMYLSNDKIKEVMEKSYKIIINYLQEKVPTILALARQKPVPRGRGKGLDSLIGELEDVRKNH